MKMLFILWVILSLGTDLHASPCVGDADDEYHRATSKGAKTKMKLHVVDDEGLPVSNVDVEVVFAMGADFQPGFFKTDAEGIAVVEGVTTGNTIEFFLKNESYYNSYLKLRYLKFAENRKVKDGKWQPWGEVRSVVLRKIDNPIQLRHHCRFVDVPQTNVWVGLDMERGDWVGPFGKGVVPDIELLVQWDGLPMAASRDCSMQVRIPGESCGGTFVNKVLESEYPNSKSALTNYAYDVSSFDWKEREKGTRLLKQSFWNQRDLVVRLRCIVDESGHVKEAHYGCICELEVAPGDGNYPTLALAFVFNPTSNDVNLEIPDIAQRTYKRYEREKRLERERREKETKTVWGGIKKMFGAP